MTDIGIDGNEMPEYRENGVKTLDWWNVTARANTAYGREPLAPNWALGLAQAIGDRNLSQSEWNMRVRRSFEGTNYRVTDVRVTTATAQIAVDFEEES